MSADLIPPPDERPVCVTVAWLQDHPHTADRLDFLDGDTWMPAHLAQHAIDPEWPVIVRERPAVDQ